MNVIYTFSTNYLFVSLDQNVLPIEIINDRKFNLSIKEKDDVLRFVNILKNNTFENAENLTDLKLLTTDFDSVTTTLFH